MPQTITKMVHLGPSGFGTTHCRNLAFSSLGLEIIKVDDRALLPKYRSVVDMTTQKFMRRLNRPMETNHENRRLIESAKNLNPDLIFVEKGLTIRPKTLLQLRESNPNAKLICYSMDDMSNPRNSSSFYRQSIPIYSAHVTTKPYNVEELEAKGARQVIESNNAYCEMTHRPIKLTEFERIKYGADVSFIGGYEKERAKMLQSLAASGVHVRVWGNNWKKMGSNKYPLLKIEYRPAYGKEYAQVVSASKILLGFLRKANRDRITTRTLEIPAMEGFFLAERTNEQLNILRESIDAEFFSSRDELIAKVRYYLNNESERTNIARNGRSKVLDSEYDYVTQMKQLLSACEAIEVAK